MQRSLIEASTETVDDVFWPLNSGIKKFPCKDKQTTKRTEKETSSSVFVFF